MPIVQAAHKSPATRQEFETMLDAGRIFVAMGNGRFWQCRRNGQTQTWKTRPNDFRVPVKAGFRTTGQFTQDELGSSNWQVR